MTDWTQQTETARTWFETLRDRICAEFEAIEREAGSGATFGFVALGRVARDLEALCDAILEIDVPPSSGPRGDIDGLLKDLRRAVEVPPDPPLVAPAQSPGLVFATAAGERERTVILVEDDEPVARQLERDLTSFGFQVFVLGHPYALREEVAKTQPAAVILDVVFAGDDRVSQVAHGTHQSN